MLRVAVIGAGSIGLRHIRNLLELGCEVFVRDADDARLEAVKAEHGVLFAHLSERYDAAVIATPYRDHLRYAAHFIAENTPVFVEKPLGAIDQLSDWRAFERNSRHLVTQVGYQLRFHRVAQAMRSLVPGESGFFATACDMRTWPGKSYGPLLLEASHDLDLALSMGAPATVTDAVIDPHYVAIQLGPHWRVTIEDRADYRREWTVEQRGQSMSVTFNSPDALGALMYYDEMRHFVECVREGRQTDCPLSDGVRVLEVAAQAEQMARRAA